MPSTIWLQWNIFPVCLASVLLSLSCFFPPHICLFWYIKVTRDCLWLRSACVPYNLGPVLQGKLLLRHEKGAEEMEDEKDTDCHEEVQLLPHQKHKDLVASKSSRNWDWNFTRGQSTSYFCLRNKQELVILHQEKTAFLLFEKLFSCFLSEIIHRGKVNAKEQQKKRTVKNISGGNSWDRAVSEVLLESITFI